MSLLKCLIEVHQNSYLYWTKYSKIDSDVGRLKSIHTCSKNMHKTKSNTTKHVTHLQTETTNKFSISRNNMKKRNDKQIREIESYH